MSIHATDVIRIVPPVFPISELQLGDRTYSVPSQDWVADVFSRYHWGARTPYAAERFDCEDLALEAVVLARKLHAQSTTELHGLACGWLYYTPTKQTLGVQYGNQDHALTWFITGTKGNETILFFEPQRSYTVPLEPEELQSVYGANM